MVTQLGNEQSTDKRTFSKLLLTDLILIVISTLVASIPLFFKGIDGTIYQDLQFHLSRIESLKEGILSGELPVMMQSVWMKGKGYPVSIFYGDFLLYIPALFRICGFGVVTSYKIFVWVINFLTAFSALICFKKMFKRREASYVATFLYVTASYRLMDIYVRAAVGEYISFIFFPVIALAMYLILFSEQEDKKRYYGYSFILALGMTGLIESHMLSSVMTVFLLVILCILFAKRTFRKKSLLCILLAAGETLLINLYFLVPFMDYYIHEPVYAGTGGDHSQAMQIRECGAYVSQFFDFFGHIFGRNIDDVNLRMQLTVGLGLTIGIVAAFILFLVKFREYKIFVVGAMSVLCLWMSTNLFPWNTLEGYTHLFKFLSKVQFPWRYLAAATLFIALLVGMLVDRMMKASEVREIEPKAEELKADEPKTSGWKVAAGVLASLLVVCALATSVSFAAQYKKGYFMVEYKDYSEVDSGYMGACEYLKEGTELIVTDYVPENPQLEDYRVVKQKDNSVTMYVKNGGEQSFAEVPKLNYKGYVAYDQDKNRLEITNGYLNLINVTLPANYEGEITVRFKQPVLWRISEIISLLSFAVFLVLFRRVENRH